MVAVFFFNSLSKFKKDLNNTVITVKMALNKAFYIDKDLEIDLKKVEDPVMELNFRRLSMNARQEEMSSNFAVHHQQHPNQFHQTNPQTSPQAPQHLQINNPFNQGLLGPGINGTNWLGANISPLTAGQAPTMSRAQRMAELRMEIGLVEKQIMEAKQAKWPLFYDINALIQKEAELKRKLMEICHNK